MENKLFTKKIEADKEASQGIFSLSHYTQTVKIAPVVTSTYRTVNFATHPDHLLFSGGLSACVVLLIKNYNPNTQQYDNITTMAHFFPNNAYDDSTAAHNITEALTDFQKAGGTLTKQTSIQLLGGIQQIDLQQPYNTTVKAILEDALKALTLDQQCTVKIFNGPCLNTHPTEGLYLFVHKEGTQITKTENAIPQDAIPLATKCATFPADFLSTIAIALPQSYQAFNKQWSTLIAKDAQIKNGMSLHSMEEAIGIFQTLQQLR